MAQATIPVSQGTTEVPTDEPLPKAVAYTVFAEIRDRGYNVPRVRTVFDTDHPETPDGTGIIPPFARQSDPAGALVRSADFPFTIAGETPEGAGEDSGSAHVTTHKVRGDMGVRTVVGEIVENGGFDTAVTMIERTDTDADPVTVAAYAVATYAKGWIAEQVITSTDRFSKGSQSNDEYGQDVFDKTLEKYRQVKSVTVTDDAPEGTLFYQWDCRGGLVIGDDYKAVTKAISADRVGHGNAKATEVNSTLTYRTSPSSRYKIEDDRNIRYVWW